MVPLENSVEGGVPATLDALAGERPLVILAESYLAVVFDLLARPGTDAGRRSAPSPPTRTPRRRSAATC